MYLHPSDTTSGTPIISIKLKGTENYNIWSRSMLLAVSTKNKLGFISGSCVKSTTDIALASQWDRCNIVVLSWMLGTLSEEFLKQNDSPLSEYYHNLNNLWKQYDSMVSSPPCTCGANACNCDASTSFIQNNNRLKLMQFLMGLNDVYMSVRSNILLRDPLPDVKTAYAVISIEESHRIGSSKEVNNKTQTYAFVAQASTSGSSPISFSNEQKLKLLSLINDAPSSVSTSSMSAMEEYCDLRNKKIKGIGKEEGGLYIFNNSESECKNNFNDNSAACAASSNLWHMRLGHPSDQVLLVLKNKLNLKTKVEEEPCDICHKAKQSKSPFPLSDHKTLSLGCNTPSESTNGVLTLVPQFSGHALYMRRFRKFFDDIFKNHIQNTSSPNDEGITNDTCDGSSDSSQDNENSPTVTHNEDQSSIPEGNSDSSTSNTEQVSDVRRSSRSTVFPKKYDEFVVDGKVKYGIERVVNYSNLNSENFYFVSNLDKILEPKTYDQACKDLNWVEAMNLEIEALNRLGKYRFTLFKERLVAKGFSQNEGIDYEETFSPVVKHVTVRCFITIAIQNNWPLHQLDINNAFLYGEFNEEIYMKLLEGYYTDYKDKNKVCKLTKSLYGLKQAPRQWNAKLNEALLENVFVQSKSDYSLYTKTSGSDFMVLLVYVDDIVITGNDISQIEQFKKFLKTNFIIKDLGEFKYFLGIEVLKTEKGICLSQRKYCLELLNDYGLLGYKPTSTPIETNLCVNCDPSDKDQLLSNITEYHKLVGRLIYLTLTRPEYLLLFIF
ncbi:uncharacterized protein [Rutidosis leptorrhynchoides]|uniref:uncharacterized protein n=1 Tax=Rutidosis leptorrhynchoides TaxID=125765 RepID=UPI003A9A4079